MSGIWPPVLLLTLGCLLLRNVRQVAQRRVQAVLAAPRVANINPSYIEQIDGQITTMLLLQSFVAIPSFLPFGAQNLYSSITDGWYKSPLRLAWENVIIETIRLFSYLFYSTSFYVSLYSSRGFRRQVWHFLEMKRNTSHIHPLNTTAQIRSTNILGKTEQREL